MATQGPLESTIADFWKMVCQVKSRAIVMLCNLQERGEVRREREREREREKERDFHTLTCTHDSCSPPVLLTGLVLLEKANSMEAMRSLLTPRRKSTLFCLCGSSPSLEGT